MQRHTLVVSSTLLFALSCSSWIESTRKAIVGDDSPRQGSKSQETRWVPKGQYDSLQTKYSDLNRRYQELKDGSPQQPANSESVDVFGKGGMAEQASGAAAMATVAAGPLDLTEKGFNEQKKLFDEGRAAMVNGKLDQARANFMQLSRSQVYSMRAESKLYLGMIYFEQKNYDLSLQVFEDIMNQEAASGQVLNALKMAVRCSDQLNLPQKKARYQSILTDLFEMRS